MFRVEHVGSFVRPGRLLDAARAHKAGKIASGELRKVQDDCIRDIVAFQESLGLPTITDGEFRRRSWSAGFIDAVEGFGLRDGTLTFRNEGGVIGIAASPYARARLKRKQRIVADDYRFLKTEVQRGVAKVTIAAPDVMHYFLGPQSYDTSVYRDREAYLEDLAAIYRQEIAELVSEGCRYLQLDDTALACNCDAHARADVAARGESADELTARYAKLFNDCVAGNPAGERAGDFSPLRFVPKGKRVILGLVSTKTPVLESKEFLRRQIDAAAKHVPLEQLGIGPQCGFSSAGGGGQPITQDDTRRKLELIMDVARKAWGDA